MEVLGGETYINNYNFSGSTPGKELLQDTYSVARIKLRCGRQKWHARMAASATRTPSAIGRGTCIPHRSRKELKGEYVVPTKYVSMAVQK